MFIDAQDIPDAIQWYEGLLLTPQHFQQLSLRHEALVQYSTSLAAPFCWGIRRFDHCPLDLQVGKLRVLKLEGIMPDGLVVSSGLESSDVDSELVLDLAPHKEKMKDGLQVHLAVAPRQRGNSIGDQRYRSFKGESVTDQIPGGTPIEIPRLKPQLSLHTSDTLPGQSISFPLAQVTYRNSIFALDPEFIPAMLAVPYQSADGEDSTNATVRLGQMCSRAAEKVRNHAMYLSDTAQNKSADNQVRDEIQKLTLLVSQLQDEVKTRSLMLSLMGSLPYFEAALKTGVTHPYMIYLALCSMAGLLAVMGPEMVSPSFNEYDHRDLYKTFKPVLEFVSRMVEQGVPRSYIEHPFKFRDDGKGGVFEIQFIEEWKTKQLVIGIKGEQGMSEREVIKWGENCLIASESNIESGTEMRVKGAVRSRADRVGEVVPAKGVVFFSLDADSADAGGGRFIEPNRKLQVLNPGRIQPAGVVLYVLEPVTK
jgi:type VI secretion system protein ImpJ